MVIQHLGFWNIFQKMLLESFLKHRQIGASFEIFNEKKPNYFCYFSKVKLRHIWTETFGAHLPTTSQMGTTQAKTFYLTPETLSTLWTPAS